MTKVIITGSGAAPGVPSIAKGWGNCDPNNPKNRRRRSGTYIEIKNQKFLIDTSPDLREQLLDNNIRNIDAVLYTHAHADHLHGIDDLREINRIKEKTISAYGIKETLQTIRERFPYLVSLPDNPHDPVFYPSIILNEVRYAEKFYIGDVSIVPLKLEGHTVVSIGYMINDGEIVYISDCSIIPQETLDLIFKKPKLLVVPLTCLSYPYKKAYHMGLDTLLEYAKIIGAEKTVINHMAVECDYDEVNNATPNNVFPAYDNMVIEF